MLICLIGTGGTGKSVLCGELAKETGMEYYSAPTRKIPVELRGTTEGQKMILDLYQELFEELMEKAWDTDVICDRSLFDVMAYGLAYGAWTEEEVKVLSSKYFSHFIYPDHLFYLPIEFDLKPDGDREAFSDKRVGVDEAIKWILKQRGIKCPVITGTVEERVSLVRNILGR